MLSSPTMPAPVRQDLEARIMAGESIRGPDIDRARQAAARHGKVDIMSTSARLQAVCRFFSTALGLIGLTRLAAR
jgi:hypothetical protein